MKPEYRPVVRRQLDKALAVFADARDNGTSCAGWVRSIRDALGMSARQLGVRLGVTPQRVYRLEQDEIGGGVSLKTLREAATALDCVLVYALVPRSSLEQTVQKRARLVAERMVPLTDETVTAEGRQAAVTARAAELARELPGSLWDEPAGKKR